jgi:hypothetical protein
MKTVEEKFPALFEENDDIIGAGQLLIQAAGPQRFDFKKEDVVLMALPETDKLWIDVVEECFVQQVHMIIPPKHKDTTFIAQTIREEQVSILVIPSVTWPDVFQALNAQPENISRMQVIISDGKGAPETRFSLLPNAFPKV